MGISKTLRKENSAQSSFNPNTQRQQDIDAELTNSSTFTVYTTGETDQLIQNLRDTLASEEKEIKSLKDDLKTLSDANDALTKRLNNLETANATETAPK